MRKTINGLTLGALALLPTWAIAADYVAPTVSIKDPDTTSVTGILNNVLGWVIGLVGGIAVLFLLWGGLQYITSAGNKDKAAQAKQTITYAVMGLIVIVLAGAIVVFVTTLPTDIGVTK